MLTKFDKGEMRFQIDFYTNYRSVILEKSDNEFDVLLIRDNRPFETLEYVVTLKLSKEIEFVCITAINGPKDDNSFENLYNEIKHAIDMMNYYRVGKGNGYGE